MLLPGSTAQRKEVGQIFGKIKYSGLWKEVLWEGGESFATKPCCSLRPFTPFPKPPSQQTLTRPRLQGPLKPLNTALLSKFSDT